EWHFCHLFCIFFFFSSRRRHTRFSRDWSSDVCSSDLAADPRRPVVQRETTEASDLNALATCQSLAHLLEQRLDRELDILVGKMLLLRGDDFYQLGLRHRGVPDSMA